MTDWKPHADRAIAALRRHAKCECQSKAFWPWKRDVTCERCLALKAYDAAVAEAGKSAGLAGRE